MFTSDRGGNPDVYVMAADGSDLRQVTATPATERQAAWSPDGSRLAIAADDEHGSQIVVLPVP